MSDAALALHPLLPQAPPLYLTVARSLAGAIERRTLAPGDRLPAERDLCRQFRVSRVTIRRALAEMRDHGLIEADGTRGWFVAAHLGEPNRLMSFSEMALGRGLVPGSRVLLQRSRPASIDEAEMLGIAPGSALLDLERVRLLDGVAVALEHSRVVLQWAPGLLAGDFEKGSLYEALRRAEIHPERADYVLQAIAAEARQAEILDVETGAPLLMASARTFDARGRAIELSASVFRGDRYRFRTTLTRSGSLGGTK